MEENKEYNYRYPHPAVATDCIIFGYDYSLKQLKVLLIKRGNEPFKDCWAFPGGFVRENETVESCALRELAEETSIQIKPEYMEQFHIFSKPERDNRERVISVAFLALVKESEVKGGDDANDAKWFILKDNNGASATDENGCSGNLFVDDDNPGSLAFDHDEMLVMALNRLREIVYFKPIVFQLLPEEFTMTELQVLYEKILGVEFDRRNFYKKMKSTGILKVVENKLRSTSRKIINYSFDEERYTELKKGEKNFRF